jgi:hypothetical protein
MVDGDLITVLSLSCEFWSEVSQMIELERTGIERRRKKGIAIPRGSGSEGKVVGMEYSVKR